MYHSLFNYSSLDKHLGGFKYFMGKLWAKLQWITLCILLLYNWRHVFRVNYQSWITRSKIECIFCFVRIFQVSLKTFHQWFTRVSISPEFITSMHCQPFVLFCHYIEDKHWSVALGCISPNCKWVQTNPSAGFFIFSWIFKELYYRYWAFVWMALNLALIYTLKKCIYLAASGLRCGMQDLRWGRTFCCNAQTTVAHGLRCSVACGILVPQGSNFCTLHCQVNS